MFNEPLKDNISRTCMEWGADLVGYASAARWREFNEVPEEFHPKSLWDPAESVIVLGVQMPLPIVETTPSVLHMELYRTANRKLDILAYDLTRRLNRDGFAAFFFPRDGYSSIKALKQKTAAAFGHVMAAKYAGCGTVGVSHCLLTGAYGPRVRFVSVFTAVSLSPDPLVEKDLCIKCGMCAECCPKKALTMRKDRTVGDYDKKSCLEMAEELSIRRCYPCGICTKVCPVGLDRKLYKQKNIMKKYRNEQETLAADPEAAVYRSWSHIRRYGTSK